MRTPSELLKRSRAELLEKLQTNLLEAFLVTEQDILSDTTSGKIPGRIPDKNTVATFGRI